MSQRTVFPGLDGPLAIAHRRGALEWPENDAVRPLLDVLRRTNSEPTHRSVGGHPTGDAP